MLTLVACMYRAARVHMSAWGGQILLPLPVAEALIQEWSETRVSLADSFALPMQRLGSSPLSWDSPGSADHGASSSLFHDESNMSTQQFDPESPSPRLAAGGLPKWKKPGRGIEILASSRVAPAEAAADGWQQRQPGGVQILPSKRVHPAPHTESAGIGGSDDVLLHQSSSSLRSRSQQQQPDRLDQSAGGWTEPGTSGTYLMPCHVLIWALS